MERQNLEKQKQEKLDQEEKAKQKQARLAQTRKDHQERSQRLKLKNLHQGRLGGQTQEREEWERSNWEDKRRLEDQQRIGLDELLNIVQDTNLQPREDIQTESSGARLEEISNNTTVRIKRSSQRHAKEEVITNKAVKYLVPSLERTTSRTIILHLYDSINDF